MGLRPKPPQMRSGLCLSTEAAFATSPTGPVNEGVVPPGSTHKKSRPCPPDSRSLCDDQAASSFAAEKTYWRSLFTSRRCVRSVKSSSLTASRHSALPAAEISLSVPTSNEVASTVRASARSSESAALECRTMSQSLSRRRHATAGRHRSHRAGGR